MVVRGEKLVNRFDSWLYTKLFGVIRTDTIVGLGEKLLQSVKISRLDSTLAECHVPVRHHDNNRGNPAKPDIGVPTGIGVQGNSLPIDSEAATSF